MNCDQSLRNLAFWKCDLWKVGVFLLVRDCVLSEFIVALSVDALLHVFSSFFASFDRQS